MTKADNLEISVSIMYVLNAYVVSFCKLLTQLSNNEATLSHDMNAFYHIAGEGAGVSWLVFLYFVDSIMLCSHVMMS